MTCKECGGRVSSTAEACPHCGAPIAGKRDAQIQGSDAFLLLGSFLLGIPLSIFLSALPGEDGNQWLRLGLGVGGWLPDGERNHS